MQEGMAPSLPPAGSPIHVDGHSSGGGPQAEWREGAAAASLLPSHTNYTPRWEWDEKAEVVLKPTAACWGPSKFNTKWPDSDLPSMYVMQGEILI